MIYNKRHERSSELNICDEFSIHAIDEVEATSLEQLLYILNSLLIINRCSVFSVCDDDILKVTEMGLKDRVPNENYWRDSGHDGLHWHNCRVFHYDELDEGIVCLHIMDSAFDLYRDHRCLIKEQSSNKVMR